MRFLYCVPCYIHSDGGMYLPRLGIVQSMEFRWCEKRRIVTGTSGDLFLSRVSLTSEESL